MGAAILFHQQPCKMTAGDVQASPGVLQTRGQCNHDGAVLGSHGRAVLLHLQGQGGRGHLYRNSAGTSPFLLCSVTVV